MTQETGLEQKPANTTDQAKRRTLQRLAFGAAFVAPVITSVSMDGLTISKVHAKSAASSSMKDDDCEYDRPTKLRAKKATKKAVKKVAKKKGGDCLTPVR